MNIFNRSIFTAAVMLAAAFGVSAQSSTEVPGVHINTYVEDFNYETLSGMLSIESFVENNLVDPIVTVRPLDIVMVLDASSSMSNDQNKVTIYSYTAQSSQEYTYNNYDNTYFYLYNGKYYQVSRGRSGNSSSNYRYYLKFNTGTQDYYLTGTEVSTTQPTYISSNTDTIWTGVLYSRTTTKKTRLEVMKEAAANFFDIIREKSEDFNNRMAIVSFSKYASSYPTYSETNPSSLLSVKDNATALRKYITDLGSASGTGTLNGVNRAAAFINRISDEDLKGRDQVMFVFSDGDPDGYGDEANKVVEACKTLKENKGVTIYSIGLLDGTVNNYTAKMMENLSSNYPHATSTNDNDRGARADGDYYWNDPTGESLNELFSMIADKLDPSAITIPAESEIQVTFASTIKFNLSSGTSEVKAYTADCISYVDGAFGFGDLSPLGSLTIEADPDLHTVETTGFDYSENWCGVEGTTPHGKKLVLKVPFKFAPNTIDDVMSNLFNTDGEPGLYKDERNLAMSSAPSVPQFKSLTVSKAGLRTGESVILEIVRKPFSGESANVPINRIVLTGTDKNGTKVSQKLRLLNPSATYVVTEHTDWSWTYAPSDTKETNGFVVKEKDMTTVPEGSEATIDFTNSKYDASLHPKTTEIKTKKQL